MCVDDHRIIDRHNDPLVEDSRGAGRIAQLPHARACVVCSANDACFSVMKGD